MEERSSPGRSTHFGLDVSGLRVVDVGASTGGFTDCVLQRGARSVCAIDVGYGQLAWSLRTDPRVTVFERTNIRSRRPRRAGRAVRSRSGRRLVHLASQGAAQSALAHRPASGQLVALVKPQFEVGKGRVGKRGVVREPLLHEEVLEASADACTQAGLVVRGLTFSPIKGPEGNIEFWMWAARQGAPAEETAQSVVEMAHAKLGG